MLRYLIEFLGMSRQKAEEVERIIKEQARTFGRTQDSAEGGVTDEDVKAWHRRQFVFGGVAALVAAPSSIAAIPAAKRVVIDYAKPLKYLFVGEKSFSFSPLFIEGFENNRRNKDFWRTDAAQASQETKLLTSAHCAFIERLPMRDRITGESELLKLRHLLARAADSDTRLIVADVLTNEQVRSGNSEDAKVDFGILKYDYDNPNMTKSFIEKKLSIAYTSILREDALTPSKWGFDDALELAGSELDLNTIGILCGSNGVVNVPSEITLTDSVIESGGVKLFYILNFIVLYWTVNGGAEGALECATIHYKLLARYEKHGGFSSEIWNTAYIAGLQLHRMGVLKARDKFFAICFGRAKEFSSDYASRLSIERLTANEVVPLAMTLLLQTDPDLVSRYSNYTVQPKHLFLIKNRVRSLAHRQAISAFKLRLGGLLDEVEAHEELITPGVGLSIYLPDHDQLRFG